MSPIIIVLVCLVLVYVGFLVYTALFYNKFVVFDTISSVQFDTDPKQIKKRIFLNFATQVRISTVVLSANGKEAGLFTCILSPKYSSGMSREYESTFPLSKADVYKAITILRGPKPFTLDLGSQHKLVATGNTDTAYIIIRKLFFYSARLETTLNKSTIEKLAAAFEYLLETDRVNLSLRD